MIRRMRVRLCIKVHTMKSQKCVNWLAVAAENWSNVVLYVNLLIMTKNPKTHKHMHEEEEKDGMRKKSTITAGKSSRNSHIIVVSTRFFPTEFSALATYLRSAETWDGVWYSSPLSRMPLGISLIWPGYIRAKQPQPTHTQKHQAHVDVSR